MQTIGTNIYNTNQALPKIESFQAPDLQGIELNKQKLALNQQSIDQNLMDMDKAKQEAANKETLKGIFNSNVTQVPVLGADGQPVLNDQGAPTTKLQINKEGLLTGLMQGGYRDHAQALAKEFDAEKKAASEAALKQTADERTRKTEVMNQIGRYAAAVLDEAPENRPAAYQQAMKLAQGQGIDISNWPAEYDEAQTKMAAGYSLTPEARAARASREELAKTAATAKTEAASAAALERAERQRETLAQRQLTEDNRRQDKLDAADDKKQGKLDASAATAKTAITNFDDFTASLDKLDKDAGALGEGFFGRVGATAAELGNKASGGIMTSDKAKFRARLDTVLSQAFLGTLAGLKAISANGSAGLGAVSDTEGKRLTAKYGNLDIDALSTPEAVRKIIGEMKADINLSKQRVLDAQKKDEASGSGVASPSGSPLKDKVAGKTASKGTLSKTQIMNSARVKNGELTYDQAVKKLSDQGYVVE